ncbi:hypothetical protein THASP1DRAFT_26013 [Thamnocephalis sphaerospora]|uniref:G-protein coupled receptors family 1 profile domain-containing protein n=1 Tax=Thamnocephalis sphaerospora TaxID=78915 RepID=A0A4P9XJF8_9FUNG|nr:hypothetical protein THASP1DRAFT_26013 [Thamnocephalis sphaerospora]|eukprot:RKP05501.1 hypothetical protein THASP1DRAFT_26013 [Thamnocephalis sphaerospora]
MALTTIEWLPFVVGSVLLWTTDLVALTLAWTHRSFAPLKAKNLPLLTATMVASLFYWAGMAYSLGFLGDTGADSPFCSLAGLWLQYPFGLHAVLGILLFRYLKLHRVLIQCHTLTYHWQRNVILAGVLPLVTFYVVGTFVSLNITPYLNSSIASAVNRPESNTCVVGFVELSASMLIAGTLVCALAIFSMQLRKSSSSFKEFRETLHGVASQSISFALTAGLLLSGQTEALWARYLLVFVNMLATDYYIWKVLGGCLYSCLFRREESLRRYHEDYDRHARQHEQRQRQQWKEQALGSVSPNGSSYKRPFSSRLVATGGSHNTDASPSQQRYKRVSQVNGQRHIWTCHFLRRRSPLRNT